ncbi:hypothetical protein [Microvirga calopogonii]|uniref:hypothetical protein n=1 Tax=Microvirga calopogonii TaxID=2078013 RepID=UPI000E0D1C07|nr:hypothetical protein [Microvirga calopogonii]
MYRAIVLAAGLALLTGSASAETIERTVKANTISAIGGFLGYEVNTCYPSIIPDVKVRQEPANGSIQIRPHEEALGKDSHCPGTKVRGLAYVYTPKRGFKGMDEVVIDIPWSGNDLAPQTVLTKTYRIRVE